MALNHDDHETVAALRALDALDEQDAATLDPQAAAAATRFAEAVTALGEVVASDPSPSLRERVLAAAARGRTPGRPVDDGGVDEPIDAFARTVRELDELLEGLDELDWNEPARPTIGRVRDVVSHLLAVERYVLGQLDGATSRSEPDHVAMTSRAVAESADLSATDVRAQWRDAADALVAEAERADPSLVVDLHGLPLDVGGALVIRTFEVWAHFDDIARATGHRRPRLDAHRLRLMSSRLIAVYPLGMVMAGVGEVDAAVRFVLTGPGGGTYVVGFGGASGEEPAASITVDVVDLCRLAADREDLARLGADVEGDAALAAVVLGAASAFSMD